ncbi:hypothetical protein ACIQBJ_02730 [Kitasatospora sp. NPDC088391]|uniref:hypothetical protein n=1 Tax=Kitasatospora sp. NPDC088391 TaxID=3364074 RepID=UPI00381976C5
MSCTAPPLHTFTRLGRALLSAPEDTQPHLDLKFDGCELRLSPSACRTALYGQPRDPALRRAIWRQAVSDARSESRDSAGVRSLLVVWLAAPGMNRQVNRLLDLWRLDRSDLESEAVVGVLAALVEADPDAPEIGGRLIGAGIRQMWMYAGRVRKEVPRVNLGRFTRARASTLSGVPYRAQAQLWELCVAPPQRTARSAETPRPADTSHCLEGERLGALAHNVGLPELAFRARRHEGNRRVAILALRPTGGPR